MYDNRIKNLKATFFTVIVVNTLKAYSSRQLSSFTTEMEMNQVENKLVCIGYQILDTIGKNA